MAAGFKVTVFPQQAIAEARQLSTEDRTAIAQEAAAEAKANATVLTGDYRDGIHVEISGDQVAIVDDDPDAFYKEYGTSDTPAHAALTKAAKNHGEYSGYQPRGG